MAVAIQFVDDLDLARDMPIAHRQMAFCLGKMARQFLHSYRTVVGRPGKARSVEWYSVSRPHSSQGGVALLDLAWLFWIFWLHDDK